MGQIVSIGLKELISEAAVQCGDPFFKDFPKEIYEQGMFRAVRRMASEYRLFDRMYSHESKDATEAALDVQNFMAEYKFTVNGKPYEKVTHETEPGKCQYYIRYNINEWVFFYSDKAAGDIVQIFYKSTVTGESIEDGSMPVVPDYLCEELLKRLVAYVASLGIVTFSGEKAEKYSKVLKLAREGNRVDPDKVINEQWVRIRPYQPL